jgi:hypothetical protein
MSNVRFTSYWLAANIRQLNPLLDSSYQFESAAEWRLTAVS